MTKQFEKSMGIYKPGPGETLESDAETNQQLTSITTAFEGMVSQYGQLMDDGLETQVATIEPEYGLAEESFTILFNTHGFVPESLHTKTGTPAGFTWTIRSNKTNGSVARYGLLHGIHKLARISQSENSLYVVEEANSQSQLLTFMLADIGIDKSVAKS